MKRHWSQIAKLPVVLAEEELLMGHINGVFVHPESGQILGYMVGLMKVLTPADIQKWTTQAVFIRDAEALVPPAEIHRLQAMGFRTAFLNSKPVRSKEGYAYGRVRDFELDLSLNQLLGVECSKKCFFLEWGKRIFERKSIDRITDRAVIVTEEPLKKAKRPQLVSQGLS